MAERLPREAQPLPLIAVRAGHQVVRQGEASHGLWLVENGALLAIAVSTEGRMLALDVLGPGDAVGEPGDAPSPWGVRALRPCRLRPVRASLILDALAARAQNSARLAEDLAWLPVGARIQRRLIDLAERFGRPVPGGTVVGLTLTQEDLAALAGTSRESANRELRILVQQGRVEVIARGRYLVRPALRPVTS
jgi:CRP/FNR family cyclic AMP-dependent transcriptional regulator